VTKLIDPLSLAEYQALVAGIPKNCPNAIFMVAGQTFTAPQAVTFIGGVLAAVSATATAKTSWKDAQVAEAKTLAADGPIVKGIRETLEVMYSNNTTVLGEFLITPRKPYTPLSVEAKAAAAAKAKATRAARGTKGKVQKAAILGNVTGVTITPVTSGTAAPVGSTPSTTSVPVPSAPAPAPGATPATPSASATPVATVAPVTAGTAHS
jgi:hypothetical protein